MEKLGIASAGSINLERPLTEIPVNFDPMASKKVAVVIQEFIGFVRVNGNHLKRDDLKEVFRC